MKTNIIKSDKFHTVSMLYRYIIKDNQNLSYLNLLAYVLRNTNGLYPSQNSFNRFLDSLYSADYFVSSSRLGNVSYLTFQFSFVHPKFINDEAYNLDYLQDLFFKIVNTPNVVDGKFDNKSFELAKSEILTDLMMKNEKKAVLARDNAFQIFFKGTDALFPLEGNASEIAAITNEELYAYYQKIVKYPGVYLATGDIDYKVEVKDYLISDYYIKNRAKLTEKKIVELDNVNQTNLIMIYDLSIFKYDKLYYAATILNYILGVAPTSKLFLNVREKNGLCYSIRSSYLSVYGILVVSAGIDAINMDKTIDLVNENVSSMQKPSFTEDAIKEAVKYYENALLAALDNQRNALGDCFQDLYVENTISDEELVEKLKEVKASDIYEVAKACKDPFIYVLRGNENE